MTPRQNSAAACGNHAGPYVGSKNELVQPYSHFETLVQAPLILCGGNQSSSYIIIYGWISASPSLDCTNAINITVRGKGCTMNCVLL